MSSELARRIAFTFGALFVFRFGAYIPLPGTDVSAWSSLSGLHTRRIFDLIDMPAGASARHFAIFALGILPYITAAILMQLASIGSRRLRALSEGGERGRETLATCTLYLAIALAAFQALGVAQGLEGLRGLVPQPGVLFKLTTVLTLTAGTMLLIWLSNQITVRGIGNGLVLILAVGLVIDLPENLAVGMERARMGYVSTNMIVIALVVAIVVTTLIVFFEGARRVIAVDFPQQTIGGKMRESLSASLILKVNNAGLIPPVFASWLIVILAFGLIFSVGAESPLIRELGHGHPLFMVLFSALVVSITLFYTAFLIDPDKVSEQLKVFGGVVRGVAPGEPTADYIDNVLSRVTMLGSVYLTLLFIVPEILIVYFGLPFYLGGAPFLIVVCAALDIGAQLKQEMQLKDGGIRT